MQTYTLQLIHTCIQISDANKVIRTQMTLVPEEFDSFQVGVDTEVTFCLKELRAILAFSESANMPLSVHFESPGK